MFIEQYDLPAFNELDQFSFEMVDNRRLDQDDLLAEAQDYDGEVTTGLLF
jgi:hypothetical protein